MQCKDIPTLPILEFVAKHGGIGCNWYFNNERDVRNSIVDGFSLPDNLILAKMKMLIKKGLLGGCPCGCRGDFEITKKGLSFIERKK